MLRDLRVEALDYLWYKLRQRLFALPTNPQFERPLHCPPSTPQQLPPGKLLVEFGLAPNDLLRLKNCTNFSAVSKKNIDISVAR